MKKSTNSAVNEILEHNVSRAQAGDRAALEAVVHAVQNDVYHLALRFLSHPQDAEEAMQEILIRILTGLSNFCGESSFRTWTYRVACNTLLTLRQKRLEPSLSFGEFADILAQGQSDAPSGRKDDAEAQLLLEEVKIGCTLAMLQCLDREHRMAYILGEIMEMEHKQSAKVLQIKPAAFRKRLSRAKVKILEFMIGYCGLVNPGAACRCHRRVSTARARGCVDPSHLIFATSREHALQFPQVLVVIRQLEETKRSAALYQSHPEAAVHTAFMAWLNQLLDEPHYRQPDRWPV